MFHKKYVHLYLYLFTYNNFYFYKLYYTTMRYLVNQFVFGHNQDTYIWDAIELPVFGHQSGITAF